MLPAETSGVASMWEERRLERAPVASTTWGGEVADMGPPLLPPPGKAVEGPGWVADRRRKADGTGRAVAGPEGGEGGMRAAPREARAAGTEASRGDTDSEAALLRTGSGRAYTRSGSQLLVLVESSSSSRTPSPSATDATSAAAAPPPLLPLTGAARERSTGSIALRTSGGSGVSGGRGAGVMTARARGDEWWGLWR